MPAAARPAQQNGSANIVLTGHYHPSVVQIPPSDGTSSVLLGHHDPSGFHHGADNGTGVILIYSDPIPLV